jgi:hypothetical protein
MMLVLFNDEVILLNVKVIMLFFAMFMTLKKQKFYSIFYNKLYDF